MLRGTNRGDVIRGTNRADVIKGRAGNDRLSGRAGNDRLFGGTGKDRLVGGPGKDRLSCGGGRDTAIAGTGDVLKRCEVVNDTSGNVVPVGQQGSPGGGGPAPAGCSYRTKPVLVLENGSYVFRERVVLECTGSPGGGGAPTPPPSDWIAMLTRGYGVWVEPVQSSSYLYFFRNEVEAGEFRRGSRSFCPNNNCALAPNPPSPFIWKVQGDVATVQSFGGITTLQLQLTRYDSATDTLSLVNTGTPTSWYGCRNFNFPNSLKVPGTCL